MWMLADTPMKRCLIVALTLAAFAERCVLAQETFSSDSGVTVSEYEKLVDRVLPCPAPGLKESRDFQMCLLILPPGHRSDERELRAVLTFRAGKLEMALAEPAEGLWLVANRMKHPSEAADWLKNVRRRVFQTTDKRLVEDVMGRSWAALLIGVVPSGDWYSDPTTYRFRTVTGVGMVAVDLTGPGRGATRQSTPLLAWAERVRERATKALAKQPEQTLVQTP